MTKRRAHPFWAIGGVVLALGIGFWLAWYFDLEELDLEDIRRLGWPMIIGYTLVMIVLGGFGVPPVFFLVPAGAVWPFHIALGVGIAGGMGASMVGFWVARYWVRETVTPRIPPRLQRYEHRMESHPLRTVLVMRLVFHLFPPINWMLGISRIPLRTFAAGTLLGMLPGTLLYLLAGKGLVGVLLELPKILRG